MHIISNILALIGITILIYSGWLAIAIVNKTSADYLTISASILMIVVIIDELYNVLYKED